MPLVKRAVQTTTLQAEPTPSLVASTLPANVSDTDLPVPLPRSSRPLTKEGYWERKEERDIETGKRIRRSGVWQAALNSVGLLQLNSGNTFESYMALVAKAAEEGLRFVNGD